jgi:hypothetical protein
MISGAFSKPSKLKAGLDSKATIGSTIVVGTYDCNVQLSRNVRVVCMTFDTSSSVVRNVTARGERFGHHPCARSSPSSTPDCIAA